MELIEPITEKEHADSVTLVVAVYEINVSINTEILARYIKTRSFFDDTGERIYVKKDANNLYYKNLDREITLAADPIMQKGRGNCKTRMKNMPSFAIVIEGVIFHLKVNGRKIHCVGPQRQAEEAVNTFIDLLGETKKKLSKIYKFIKLCEEKEDKRKEIIKYLKNICMYPKDYENQEKACIIKRFSELSEDILDELKENEIMNILLEYLDDYDGIDLYIKFCKKLLYEFEDTFITNIYEPEIKSKYIVVEKVEIFNSVFHFDLKKYFSNPLIFRFSGFASYLNTIKYNSMVNKSEEEEFNPQYFPFLDKSLSATIDSKEKKKKSKKKKEEEDGKKESPKVDKEFKHRFSLPKTFTLKQMSPSFGREAYEVYLKFIERMNEFIELENNTTYKNFVFEFKELQREKKGRKKKNPTPTYQGNIYD